MQSGQPLDVATCLYHTGMDPFTKQAVHIVRNLSDCKLQRALLQSFKTENYFEVRKAPEQAGRSDLSCEACDALIPAQMPKKGYRKPPQQDRCRCARRQLSQRCRPGERRKDRQAEFVGQMLRAESKVGKAQQIARRTLRASCRQASSFVNHYCPFLFGISSSDFPYRAPFDHSKFR
jgi:hypothetical protein